MFRYPFVGYTGRELGSMLADAHLTPKVQAKWPNELDMMSHWKMVKSTCDIHLSCVFAERPADGEVENFFGPKAGEVCHDIPALKPGKYLLLKYRHYYDSLMKEVEDLKPNVVIAVGVTSSWAMTGLQKIAAIRGTIVWNDKLKVKVLPTWNPAAILRQWSLRTVAIADLLKAGREAKFPEVRRTSRLILVDPTHAEIKEWLDKPAEIHSIDIESAYALFSKAEIERMKKHAPQLVTMLAEQISMVGFARTPTDALVIPFMSRRQTEVVDHAATDGKRLLKSLNYWNSEKDEIKAWKLLQYGLEKPIPKLFQNGVYDITRLISAGMRINFCREDSMLKHHALFPEMQKGLGFLGSLYSAEPAWKGMRVLGEGLKRDE